MFFFFKQKTAYEMRISDWSSDVCSSDLSDVQWVFRGDRELTWMREPRAVDQITAGRWWPPDYDGPPLVSLHDEVGRALGLGPGDKLTINILGRDVEVTIANLREVDWANLSINFVMIFSPGLLEQARSEEHTSELQSLMRNSYAVICLKKKNKQPLTASRT